MNSMDTTRNAQGSVPQAQTGQGGLFGGPASRLLAITPFGRADPGLLACLLRQPVLAVIELGHADPTPLLKTLAQPLYADCGLRIPEGVDPASLPLPPTVAFLVVEATVLPLSAHLRRPWLAQVCTAEEARKALAVGAAGLICKGQESGGRIGHESSFVLLQSVLDMAGDRPVWCQGGVGLHTAAAILSGGAHGVVLDSLLAGLPECALPDPLKKQVLSMDGSEVREVAGYQVYARSGPEARALEGLSAADMRQRLQSGELLPIGQDAALARAAREACPSLDALVANLSMRIAAQIGQAQALRLLAENSPWARAHGTRYPIAQGPMTRVSDTAAFATAVAEAGGLPFLALSLMKAEASRRLLDETRECVAGRAWGVGVLGFAAAEILEPQLALIHEFKPSVVLLAGGRPSQARPLIEAGIPTYLHVPSPGLLEQFLKDGATHFVFEGRECGGHVGPRYSFVLWEQALAQLETHPQPETLNLLFAGGIHDARSAAMVAVMAAPLAALGARIGVLMGTAYITTEDAVRCGAVQAGFQSEALSGARTVLVETAPGHAIRCLQSRFVEHFWQEKTRLREQQVDADTAWRTLEALTIGRLRVVTKGVDYRDGKLAPVPSEEQKVQGMYMLGQVIALKTERTTIARLHADVSAGASAWLAALPVPALPRAQAAEPVAIIGMACIYPGSPDLETYWANILVGRDLVSEVPAERWNAAQYYSATEAPNRTPSKWGGFVEDYPFDPLKFGIPPQSLAAIEPVQLLSLAVADAALRDAGYAERYFDRDKTAVIFGAEAGMDLTNQYTFRNLFPQYCGELPAALDAALPKLTEDSFPGVLANVISGRIANRLGLGGVNYSVDSACASSLTALEAAVKELRSGASHMALAGGADFHNNINDYLMFASVGALSASGRCRSFDSRADGICLGEGVGVVVLKRLSDAERDGDRIYAVINAVAGSSDGRGLGLTAPRKEGQRRALERAYWQAGKLPAQIGLVEAHGTGTVVGDRTELTALTEVFIAGGALAGQAGLGSVKSQIGHTKCAAGMAGLIKVAKALHHRVLPPTAQITTPNAGYHPVSSPFRLNLQAQPWTRRAQAAAVSAFGFGGANFHAVLSHYPAQRGAVGAAAFPAELFVLRGDSREAALQLATRLLHFITAAEQPPPLRDLAATAWHEGHGPVQLAFVADNLESLTTRLQECSGNSAFIQQRPQTPPGKLAVVFPGQGSQYPDMLRELFVYFPDLQAYLDLGAPYVDAIFPGTTHVAGQAQADRARLTDTRNAQPALAMVELAAFAWLQRLGLVPDMAAGHSFGELTALTTAGAFDAASLIALAGARASAILEAAGDEPGAMAAVSLDADALAPLLQDYETLVLANRNSPEQTVISGRRAQIDAACTALRQRNVTARRIDTACAFHSPLVAAAVPVFYAALQEHTPNTLAWPVYSNTTATAHVNDAIAIREALAQQLAAPVNFVEQIRNMYAAGARVFVEVGPRRVLTGLIGKILAGQPHHSVALDGQSQDLSGLLAAVAQLAVLLPAFDASALYAARGRLLGLDAPPRLPVTTWMINGGRAWPRFAQAPAHAGQVVTQPVVSYQTSSVASAVTAVPQATAALTSTEQALMAYLDNMRELVNAQRDVLLQFMGGGAAAAPLRPTPAAPVAAFVPPAALVSEAARAPAIAESRVEDATSVLLRIVSERTGYPADMLDPALDLEADLSIDSIKRVEIVGELARALGLRARMGSAADGLIEVLSTRKTLQGMLAEIAQAVPSRSPAQSPPAQSPPVLLPETHAQAADGPPVHTLLLEVVSQATGYPVAALDLDLDLEADLSIDSIKRLEIVSQLLDRLATGGAQRDLMVERLSTQKSLRALLDLLQPDQSVTRTMPVLPATVEEAPIPLARYTLQSVFAPQAVCNLSFKGKRFLISDDGLGIARRLAERLNVHDARAEVVDFAGQAILGTEFDSVDGLIHLWPLNPDSCVRDVPRLFNLVRSLLLKRVRHLLVATGLGGDFGVRFTGVSERDFARGAGLAGMIKTLAKEFPELRAHCVDLDVREPVESLAKYLDQELTAEQEINEVAYLEGHRWVREIRARKLPINARGELPLAENDVVLLTGGARGITARIAMALTQRRRCHLEIVGRSPEPTGSEPEATRHIDDPMQLRRTLLAAQPGCKPGDIERQVKTLLAERQFRTTLAAVRASGSTVSYTQLDVRDSARFCAHIEDLYARHGRINGVIHGAGVIEDKLLRDKSPESFARVYDTKVCGAMSLHRCIRDDVKFVVFFSSVASAFGNRGQIDYASANDVLDKLAHAWQNRIEGRVLSVNWGPWADTGMVSEALEREYRKKGIGLIPLKEGVDALLDELSYGRQGGAQVLWMCGEPTSFAG